MRRDFFDYVDHIRTSEKYFDVSLQDVGRLLLARGECELTTDHDLVDQQGEEVIVPLRLNIATRHESQYCWQLALKLHNIRIDGIDYEPKFRLPDGQWGYGWHRHVWDRQAESAERQKLPVDGFEKIADRDQFLTRALSMMKIRYSAVDHGQQMLFP